MVTLETNSFAFARESFARLSTRFSRRFSQRNRDYSFINDTQDTRLPLHNEDAFGHGIRFKCKFIGSLEITKPSSKLDIIAAMRRIRYEFKVKGIRKVRCYAHVSVDGSKVTKRKSKRKKNYTEEQLFIMQHPVYRIFYVAHDSQDLNIFCYITREVPSNTFRCNVFKSAKRNQALHIVRTIGQAFDVCHKANPKPQAKQSEKPEEDPNETNIDEAIKSAAERKSTSETPLSPRSTDLDAAFAAVLAISKKEEEDKSSSVSKSDLIQLNHSEPQIPNGTSSMDPLHEETNSRESVIEENLFTDKNRKKDETSDIGEAVSVTPAPLMWEFEKKQLTAQIDLLTTQLKSETSSRIEAQAQVQHLLAQNKQLLSHVQQLTTQLQKVEEDAVAAKQTPPQNANSNNNSNNNSNKSSGVVSFASNMTPSDSPDFQPPSSKDNNLLATNLLFDQPFPDPFVDFSVDPFTSSNTPSMEMNTEDSS